MGLWPIRANAGSHLYYKAIYRARLEHHQSANHWFHHVTCLGQSWMARYLIDYSVWQHFDPNIDTIQVNLNSFPWWFGFINWVDNVNWPPLRYSKADVSSISNEGLTLKTSAFHSLYSGQFTLSTQLIKLHYLVIVPLTQHHSFFRNLPPLFISLMIRLCKPKLEIEISAIIILNLLYDYLLFTRKLLNTWIIWNWWLKVRQYAKVSTPSRNETCTCTLLIDAVYITWQNWSSATIIYHLIIHVLTLLMWQENGREKYRKSDLFGLW